MSTRTVRRKKSNDAHKVDNSSDSIMLEDEETLLDRHIEPSLKGDYLNICILLFLYILQGIPLGLIASVPYLLTNRGVSYSQQAVFSFVTWPFSLKLLWAPIVDSVYSERFGRRKSWLVPIQYLIGFFMIAVSFKVDDLMNGSDEPNMTLLTFTFFCLNFLAATQDIAVDGWALTMLRPANVGYASTCNSVGQTAGYFLGNVVFLALESADFANKFRAEPQATGFIDLQGFFYFWGIVFMGATTLVMLFKHETNVHHPKIREMSIRETYSKLGTIFKLSSIRQFTFILLTCKIGFAVTDAATGLKLIEAGVHKEHLALLAIPLVPLQILLPFLISRYTNGPKPLNIFVKAYPLRLLFGPIFVLVVYWTRHLMHTIGYFPSYYYFVIVVAYALHQIAIYSMFVSIMTFHAKISDPHIGGTYMTLLNTITNFGGNWPATVSLWFIDKLTVASCSTGDSVCTVNNVHDPCVLNGGTCELKVDGFYLETIICMVIGFLWFAWGKKRILHLQSRSPRAWRVHHS